MRKIVKSFIIICLLILLVYGSGRIYYAVTAGFSVGNITSDFTYHENWATAPLTPSEKAHIKQIFSQKFKYLGKGCQSYVFASEDGQYVLKFVKYQRFRPQAWLDYFEFIPIVNHYRLAKIEKKQKKLDMLFTSWKLAYEQLKPETGLIYVHLNKSPHELEQPLIIYDKMGFEHILNMDDMEFLLQKRANMLCATINNFANNDQLSEGKKLIDNLLQMILSEYSRGLADNDHALMQNTGAVGTQPLHIDVGQFVVNSAIVDPNVYKQELFSKTFKFRHWLNKHHPVLGQHLQERLQEIIGPEFHTLIPKLKNPHAWSVEAAN